MIPEKRVLILKAEPDSALPSWMQEAGQFSIFGGELHFGRWGLGNQALAAPEGEREESGTDFAPGGFGIVPEKGRESYRFVLLRAG